MKVEVQKSFEKDVAKQLLTEQSNIYSIIASAGYVDMMQFIIDKQGEVKWNLNHNL